MPAAWEASLAAATAADATAEVAMRPAASGTVAAKAEAVEMEEARAEAKKRRQAKLETQPAVGTYVGGRSSSPSAQLTLKEQVEIMKCELGLEGNFGQVLKQAAAQLGIESAGKPLTVVAAMCMQQLVRV